MFADPWNISCNTAAFALAESNAGAFCEIFAELEIG
jgi:hypothetical protein